MVNKSDRNGKFENNPVQLIVNLSYCIVD